MTLDKFGRHIHAVKGPKLHYKITPDKHFDFKGKRITNIGQAVSIKDAINIEQIINYILYPLYVSINKFFDKEPITKIQFTHKWVNVVSNVMTGKTDNVLEEFFADIYLTLKQRKNGGS